MWQKPRGTCECTDSIRSAIGTCPEKGHREFFSCPKQSKLSTTKEESK
ncbi:hypothetical protein KGG85_gp57 [Streptomyces phage Tefunt]|uniref:Uncharacterized protein n=1 Tax=Streptomyces phage Tefunt TaxID=2041209 RepID=A0A291LI14_9CAUD|nr:hypothetical protein KGG85_gp57 [Streptomyces phage Tefunt]ATI18997.1 hypothetical protein SEA_TEFUNT_57 [Streptomyces phage Tefunt]QAY15799.1 hypothetical protein SEA_NISHIKIGOI_58 [Streptomyces phage Nishikigoi]